MVGWDFTVTPPQSQRLWNFTCQRERFLGDSSKEANPPVEMNSRSSSAHSRKAFSWMLLARKSGFRPASMAANAGLSVAHLRRLCRENFGDSFSIWLKNERMAAARHLLAETGSVKETSATLGYRQLSQFSREFRHAHGVTAAAWAARFRDR